MRQLKGSINTIVVAGCILAIAGGSIFQQWKASQANRADYDNPYAIEQPKGIVDAAHEIQVPQSEIWQVVRVSDGDTITVKRGIQEERIRFCGIDAPESAQPLGEDARRYLQQLVDAANGQVAIVPVERDRYGRQVAEVFTLSADGSEKFLQQELLISGLAYVYPQYVDGCWNGEIMKAAEAIAQEQQVGVWATTYQRPWDYRRQQ